MIVCSCASKHCSDVHKCIVSNKNIIQCWNEVFKLVCVCVFVHMCLRVCDEIEMVSLVSTEL